MACVQSLFCFAVMFILKLGQKRRQTDETKSEVNEGQKEKKEKQGPLENAQTTLELGFHVKVCPAKIVLSSFTLLTSRNVVHI